MPLMTVMAWLVRVGIIPEKSTIHDPPPEGCKLLKAESCFL